METDSDRGKGAGLGQASWGLDQQFASKGLITSSQGWGGGTCKKERKLQFVAFAMV